MTNDVTIERTELVRWAEALAGVARTGLGFTESLYESERYEEILAIAASIAVAADNTNTATSTDREQASGDNRSGSGPAPIVAQWLRSVGTGISGYVTPKIAVGAVVSDNDGRILLVQRSDSGVWLYPTGWADVGYSAAEVALKEVREETGVRCEVVRTLAIHDGLRAGFSDVPLYSIVFLCSYVDGELAHHPQECLDVGWFAQNELPSPIASAGRWVDHAFAAIEGSDDSVYHDKPRHPVWGNPASS